MPRHQVTATGVSRTFAISDMCGAPANESASWVDPGLQHDVLLTNLPPNTTISYVYGSAVAAMGPHPGAGRAAPGWSANFSFHTGPRLRGRTRFLAFGDMGVCVPPTKPRPLPRLPIA